MNRLSPLIVRRVGPHAAPLASTCPARPSARQLRSRPGDDLKLFAIGWLGGLVFFGTFLG